MKTTSLKVKATWIDGTTRTYGGYLTMAEAKQAKASLLKWEGVVLVDILPE